MKRYEEIDILKGVAVICMIIFHFFYSAFLSCISLKASPKNLNGLNISFSLYFYNYSTIFFLSSLLDYT